MYLKNLIIDPIARYHSGVFPKDVFEIIKDKEYRLIQLVQDHLQKIKRYTVENFAESQWDDYPAFIYTRLAAATPLLHFLLCRCA